MVSVCSRVVIPVVSPGHASHTAVVPVVWRDNNNGRWWSRRVCNGLDMNKPALKEIVVIERVHSLVLQLYPDMVALERVFGQGIIARIQGSWVMVRVSCYRYSEDAHVLH